MQRLFSTFPNSWPGTGLLILRLAVGLSALGVLHVTGQFAGMATASVTCAAVLVGAFLWIGLCTPLSALAGAVMQFGVMELEHRCSLSSVIAAAAGVALAMLGPGAWSLDAWLFGRKRIV
jgi:putative oxidoreductase